MHRVIWRTGSARTHWKEEFERSPDPLAVAGEKVEIKEGMGKEGEMKKRWRGEREGREGKGAAQVFRSPRPCLHVIIRPISEYS